MATGVATGGGSRTLARGLAVLQALSEQPDGTTVAGLSARTALDRAVLYRLLGTLADQGLVVRDRQTRRYRLGVSLIELGACAARGLEVRRHALPGMRALMEQARETVCLAVRDRWDVVVVDRVEPPGRQPRTGHPVGLRAGLSDSVHGRAVVSGLQPESLAAHGNGLHPRPEDAARGFAMASEDGAVVVAAAVLDAGCDAIASVGIVAPATRVHDPSLFGPPVRALAREVSRRLGCQAAPGPRPAGH